MEERGIIIADRDGDFRKELADFFRNAGYAVETTDSAVHVLCSILEKQTPVLLLGSDFDKKISSADLIHLLKKCNRNLHVIMVSDNMPLAQARQVRQEGIFYHALKPASPEDTVEISQAVQCAFEREAENAASLGESVEGHAPQNAAQPRHSCTDSRWWLIALAVVVSITSYFSLLAGESAREGNAVAIWLFLCLCAAIIATQILPLFGMDLPRYLILRQREKQQGDSPEKE